MSVHLPEAGAHHPPPGAPAVVHHQVGLLHEVVHTDPVEKCVLDRAFGGGGLPGSSRCHAVGVDVRREDIQHVGAVVLGVRVDEALADGLHDVISPRRVTAVATAASAASRPLLSLHESSPARSSACCSSSQVSTPKPTGMPVSRATRPRPAVTAWHT